MIWNPVLTVTGSGNITLMVGMIIVEFENISGSIVIDSVLQELSGHRPDE